MKDLCPTDGRCASFSLPMFLAHAALWVAVLPPSCRKRVAIEAGVTSLWARFVGLDGKVVGIDRFGMSAPGGKVMSQLGITAESVVAAVKSLIG